MIIHKLTFLCLSSVLLNIAGASSQDKEEISLTDKGTYLFQSLLLIIFLAFLLLLCSKKVWVQKILKEPMWLIVAIKDIC